MNKKLGPKNHHQKNTTQLYTQYQTFCFQIIGKRFFTDKHYPNLSETLKMAKTSLTPSIFLSVILFTGCTVTVISWIGYYLLFNYILHSENWLTITVLLTAITAIVGFGFYPFIIRSKITNWKTKIDQELPFILSELSILASTGLTPIKIMRKMALKGKKNVSYSEFKKIIYKIDVEGKDIITAISETAKETPSATFRESLWDLANMIYQGGDLDEYLRIKADTTMQLKRDIQKEFIDQLGTYSEIYITLVLVGVLFIGIAAFLMDAMGSTFAGFNADTLLILLAYGLIPVAILVVNLLVSMAYSKSG